MASWLLSQVMAVVVIPATVAQPRQAMVATPVEAVTMSLSVIKF
jgi:hypothetical protein